MLYSYNTTHRKLQRHSEQREESVAKNSKPIEIQSNAAYYIPNRKTKRLVFMQNELRKMLPSPLRVFPWRINEAIGKRSSALISFRNDYLSPHKKNAKNKKNALMNFRLDMAAAFDSYDDCMYGCWGYNR